MFKISIYILSSEKLKFLWCINIYIFISTVANFDQFQQTELMNGMQTTNADLNKLRKLSFAYVEYRKMDDFAKSEAGIDDLLRA